MLNPKNKFFFIQRLVNKQGVFLPVYLPCLLPINNKNIYLYIYTGILLCELIEHLKKKQWLWQGSSELQSKGVYPTGYELLDERLEGGSPHHGVVELHSSSGIGELRLLCPHLRNNHKGRLSVFIQPPGNLSAQHLIAQGIDLNHIRIALPPKLVKKRYGPLSNA